MSSQSKERKRGATQSISAWIQHGDACIILVASLVFAFYKMSSANTPDTIGFQAWVMRVAE